GLSRTLTAWLRRAADVFNAASGHQIAKASGFAHRSFRPFAVHHMYAATATHRRTVTHADTRRDKKKTARRAAFPQRAGRFRWWWQVLGSNQRRLSRRFYRPPSSCLSHMPLTCAYAFRDAVPAAVVRYPSARPAVRGRAAHGRRRSRPQTAKVGTVMPTFVTRGLA